MRNLYPVKVHRQSFSLHRKNDADYAYGTVVKNAKYALELFRHFKEALTKAFPFAGFKATNQHISFASPCDPPSTTKETLIRSTFS